METINTSLDDYRQKLEQTRQQDSEARAINQKGLLLLKQNNHREALDRFREAVDAMPENPTYLLNAAQMVLLDDDMRAEPKLMAEARAWIQRIELQREDERRPLYLMLRARLPNA